VNSLLEIPTGGFLAGAWDQLRYLAKFLCYRERYKANMSKAVSLFRDGVNAEMRDKVLSDYYKRNFSADVVSAHCEIQRDGIINMKAMVAVMKDEVGITVSEHYSDVMALTLNQRYDNLYANISPEMVRRFTMLANMRLQKITTYVSIFPAGDVSPYC